MNATFSPIVVNIIMHALFGIAVALILIHNKVRALRGSRGECEYNTVVEKSK